MTWLNRTKDTIVDSSDALPGRDVPVPVPECHTVLGTPLTGPWPPGIEVAYFGLGCFWGAERIFWKLPGVYSTAVGYQGGTTPNPTYRETCSGATGHTEAVLVAFDPTVVSYADLVHRFFESHDPTQGMRQGNDRGSQYRSAVYWTSVEQRDVAIATRDAYRSNSGDPATAPSPPRSPRRARSTTPRTTTSSTSTRTRAATAASAEPASAVPSASQRPSHYGWRRSTRQPSSSRT